MALLGIMTVGTASANTGLLMSDKSSTCNEPTTVDVIGGIIITGIAGILLGDRTGLLLSDRSGLLLSDKSATGCQSLSKDGILVGD